MIKLSLVTGTRNRPADFWRLLESIERNTVVSWELVVSDASDTPLALSKLPENVRVLPERPRLGYTRGYNRAFHAATGTFVLWLNDDCEVWPGYAETALDFMEQNPKIGLGALYYAEQYRLFGVNSYFDMVYANFGIISREFGNQLGWFDEDFPMYGSDNSMAFRVLLAGRGVAGIPDARIFHYATNDIHRRENDDTVQRVEDVKRLMDKYGPHLSRMKDVYARMGGGIGHDQTPAWLRDRVAQ
jgi:GT2 family glycosyltransferase